jgi:hypothetical protein
VAPQRARLVHVGALQQRAAVVDGDALGQPHLALRLQLVQQQHVGRSQDLQSKREGLGSGALCWGGLRGLERGERSCLPHRAAFWLRWDLHAEGW